MKLTIKKTNELPEAPTPNTLYFTPVGGDIMVAWLTDNVGAVVYHTPVRGGLEPKGTTLTDDGPGVYTINCGVQPATFYLPPATGSQDVRILSFINTTVTQTGVVSSTGSDLLNDTEDSFTTTHPTSAVLVDSAHGSWTIDSISGSQGPRGPTGNTGAQGPQGCDGQQGTVGPQGAAGANGANGIDGAQGSIGGMGPPGPVNGGYTNHVHTQSNAAIVWNITHNLDRYPQITIVDDQGYALAPIIQYTSINTIVATLQTSSAGVAYCG